MLQHKEQKEENDLKSNSNMIFNELSKFVQHFVNFYLPYEDANKLLFKFCEQY